MAVNEDIVREELKKVYDPDLFVNIVDLGLVYLVDVRPREDGKSDIAIEMTLTSPTCPSAPQMINGCKSVLSRLSDVNEVSVKVVMAPPWGPDKMTEDARDQLGIF